MQRPLAESSEGSSQKTEEGSAAPKYRLSQSNADLQFAFHTKLMEIMRDALLVRE